MRKGCSVLFVFLLIMNSLLVLSSFTSAPVEALDYGMDTNLGSVNASFLGERKFDDVGYSVAGAGDVNGDGFDDILIGAKGNFDGGTRAGQTYLIFGKPSGWTIDIDLSASDASFWGEDVEDNSGDSVAGAGDVNGDGYDDILIGAPSTWHIERNPGRTYLILGKASGWAMDTDLSDSDASFWGEVICDRSGGSVAGAGDVNGDGFDDILIGAAFNDETGRWAGQTYLILGKASGWAMDTNLSDSDASFLGENEDDFSGGSVAGAGDVNGDGFDDILIGAHHNDDGGIDAGQTYLILGKDSGWAMDTKLSDSNASFWGENGEENEGDKSGSSIAGAGDVNGDGYDDILISATRNDEGGHDAGQTYLLFGKASGWAMDTNLSESNASFWGEKRFSRMGPGTAGAGDINGDGYDDFLIGGPMDINTGWSVGQTYLILGKNSGWAMDTNLSDSDASFLGEDNGDYAGYSVAGAGDVNGDGYDDILIGAPYNRDKNGFALPGQTYLIFLDHYSGPILNDESLTPSYGDTSTMFHFSITYRSIEGYEPADIRLVIDGQSYPWSINESFRFDYKEGVWYNCTLKLTEGIHEYYYYASDGLFDVRYPQIGKLTTPYVLKNITDEDSDGDGFYDIKESEMTSNPYDEYSIPFDWDGDEWNNSVETEIGTDPRDNASIPPDMDEDRIPDFIDPDRDGDGVLNVDDAFPDDRSRWEEGVEDEEGSAVVWWVVGIVVFVIVVGVIVGVMLVRRRKRKGEDMGDAVDKFGRVEKDRDGGKG